MSAFKDLDPCSYFPIDGDALLAVGWLGADVAFPRGSVPPDFYEKLKALCADPWAPAASAGFHQCQLCQFDGPRFNGNVFVPFMGQVYVAPVGIVHYVGTHRYAPPQVFMDAVLECPPMRSLAYHKALLANGGRALVQLGAGRAASDPHGAAA